MTAETLINLLKSGDSPVVLDVRTAMEFNAGHIKGAVHAPLSKLFSEAKTASPDKQRPMVLVCEHGPRAQLALAFLKMRGYQKLELLSGHMHKWRQAGLPLA